MHEAIDKQRQKYLSHTEAAEYLGMNPGTLYNKVSKGEIPAYRFKHCKFTRYKVSDLDNLFEPVR